MPLFSKFSTKKAPSRKAGIQTENVDDLFDENRTISLRLGDCDLVFENGTWSPDDGNSKSLNKTVQILKNKVQELDEANNMLKLKNAVLLNMLTQATADCHVKQKEIERLLKSKRL